MIAWIDKTDAEMDKFWNDYREKLMRSEVKRVARQEKQLKQDIHFIEFLLACVCAWMSVYVVRGLIILARMW